MAKLYLDSDGVITNTSKANCQKLGIRYPSHADGIDMTNYGWVRDQVGADKFYKTFKGEKFWANLDAYPWARDLLDYVNTLTKGHFKILTRAMDDPKCFSGKYKWWHRHFPEYIGKLVIVGPSAREVVDGEEVFTGGEKEFFVTSEKDILVDDSLKNVTKWEGAGGTPMWWREIAEDAPHYIIDERKMQIAMLWARANNEKLNLIA